MFRCHLPPASCVYAFLSSQEFLEDVVPIINLQLTTPTLEGLAYLFSQYLSLLNRARSHNDAEGSEGEPSEGGDEDMEVEGGGDGEVLGKAKEKRPAGLLVRPAESDAQQLALLVNAMVLAEELPRLAARLTTPLASGGAALRPSLREQRRSSGGEAKK